MNDRSNIQVASPDAPVEKVVGGVASQVVSRPHVVSLFCGAGGLDLGFQQAGFNIAAAIDSDPAAVKTHKKNFPAASCECIAIRAKEPSAVRMMIQQKLPPGAAIGVIGGPPCQGFSRANAQKFVGDPRNALPNAYLKVIKDLSAQFDVRFVLFENVTGLLRKQHRRTLNNLVKGLQSVGLVVFGADIEASSFGVPQIRRRLFLIALPLEAARTFSYPTANAQQLNVRDVISNLPPPTFFKRGLAPSDIPFHPNHWTMQPKSQKFGRVFSSAKARSFRRLEWDKPSRTVAFGHREIHVHPNGDRRLSIFEAMLLQGFPSDFELIGNLSEQVTQVSNAVPPPLAAALARRIAAALGLGG